MKSLRLLLPVILLSLAAPLPAQAQFEGDWAPCHEGAAEVAIAACTRLVQRKPIEAWKLAEAHFSRGLAYASKNDFAKAVEDYTRAIEIDGDDVWAYSNR